MNERIKQLAEAAEQFALNKANQGTGGDEFDEVLVDKFSELLIKEVMQVIANTMSPATGMNGYTHAARAVIDHFEDAE